MKVEKNPRVHLKIEPKTNLTDEQKESFLEAVKNGVPLHTALKGSNIQHRCFDFWVKLTQEIRDIKSQQELEATETYEQTDYLVCNKQVADKLTCKKNYAQEVVDFITAYEEAKSSFIYETMNNLHTADSKDWQRYAWLLERTLPSEFGRRDPDKQKVEAKPITKISVQYVDPQQDKDRLEAMQKLVESEVNGKREE